MKHHFIITLLIVSVTSMAQETDPNAKARAVGLTDAHFQYFCNAAKGDAVTETDWGLPVVFEFILRSEGRLYETFGSKKEALDFISKMWNEKYSCIYCSVSGQIAGSLDMISLYYSNQQWVYDLYSWEVPNRANVNSIRLINSFYKKEGTLIDFVDYITEERPTTAIKNYEGKKRDIQGYVRTLVETLGSGARRKCELDGTCVDKDIALLDAMMRPLEKNRPIAEYEKRLSSDPSFAQTYAYYHRLIQVILNKDELKYIPEYSYEKLKANITPNLYIGLPGFDERKNRNEVCDVLSKYGVEGFYPNSSYKHEEQKLIKCK